MESWNQTALAWEHSKPHMQFKNLSCIPHHHLKTKQSHTVFIQYTSLKKKSGKDYFGWKKDKCSRKAQSDKGKIILPVSLMTYNLKNYSICHRKITSASLPMTCFTNCGFQETHKVLMIFGAGKKKSLQKWAHTHQFKKLPAYLTKIHTKCSRTF